MLLNILKIKKKIENTECKINIVTRSPEQYYNEEDNTLDLEIENDFENKNNWRL